MNENAFMIELQDIQAKLQSLSDSMTKIEKVMTDNGRPGLPTRMIQLEERFISLKDDVAELKVKVSEARASLSSTREKLMWIAGALGLGGGIGAAARGVFGGG